MSHRPSRFKSDLNFAIEEKLREAGIEIPFPQRDLHIRSGSLKAAGARVEAVAASLCEACPERRLAPRFAQRSGYRSPAVSSGRASPLRMKTFPLGHKRKISHCRQSGRRAKQRRRPCQMSQWLQFVQCLRGTSFIRSRSIFSGSVLRVSRSRWESRDDVRIDHDAFVFPEGVAEHDVRRFPADARQPVQLFHRVGNAARMFCHDRGSRRANALGLASKEAGGTDQAFERSAAAPWRNPSRVRYFAKSAGVTRFTRLSVHCAERIVATSSSSGLRKSSSQCAPG